MQGIGGSRFAATANAELSLRLSAPGSRSAQLRIRHRKETNHDLHENDITLHTILQFIISLDNISVYDLSTNPQ